MTTDPPNPREQKRSLGYAAGAILIVGGLVAVAASRDARLTSEALHRIRERLATHGAATSIAELQATLQPGDQTTTEWLDDFGMLNPRRPSGTLHEARGLRSRLVDVRREGGSTTEIAELTALLAFLEGPQAEPLLILLEALEQWPDERPEINPLDDGQRLAFRVSQGVPAPVLERALDSGKLAPINAASSLAIMMEEGGQIAVRVLDYLHLVGVLTRSAGLSAVDGDHAEAARRLGLAFHAAGLMAEVPWLAPHAAWLVAERLCLGTLQAILPGLPPDRDLSAIEAHVRSMDPQGRLLEALRGECAFASAFREDAHSRGPGPRPRRTVFWRDRGGAAEELEFLVNLEHVIVAAERGGPEGVRELEALRDRLKSAPNGSSDLISNMVSFLKYHEEFEATRQRALSALNR